MNYLTHNDFGLFETERLSIDFISFNIFQQITRIASYFQSFGIFPFVKARKKFGAYETWVVKVAIFQELYFYSYIFFLPNYFLTYQKDFELQIKLYFIQSYSSKKLKMILPIFKKVVMFFPNKLVQLNHSINKVIKLLHVDIRYQSKLSNNWRFISSEGYC